MKALLITLLSLLMSVPCFGIIDYQPYDSLFIWAESGLNMREHSSSSAKVVTKIPFGAGVKCMGEKSWHEYVYGSQKIQDKTETSEGKPVQVTLKGNWVKVKYDGYEGYVFDAYLSKLKPPQKRNGNTYLFEYFKEACNSLTYLEQRKLTSESGRNKVLFSNGGFLTEHYNKAGLSFQMSIPDFSIEEAYLLIRRLDNYAVTITQDKEGVIKIGQDAGGWYTIESFKDIVIISGESGGC